MLYEILKLTLLTRFNFAFLFYFTIFFIISFNFDYLICILIYKYGNNKMNENLLFFSKFYFVATFITGNKFCHSNGITPFKPNIGLELTDGSGDRIVSYFMFNTF